MSYTRFKTWDDVVTVPRAAGGECAVLHRILWGWRDGRWWRVKGEMDITAPCAQGSDA